jgi:hypothetical protein
VSKVVLSDEAAFQAYGKESEYRLDVWHVTRDAHMENL